MVPVIGSVWIANDGRRMRVKRILTQYNPPRVILEILNRNRFRQRYTTDLKSEYFSQDGSGFMKPCNEE